MAVLLLSISLEVQQKLDTFQLHSSHKHVLVAFDGTFTPSN